MLHRNNPGVGGMRHLFFFRQTRPQDGPPLPHQDRAACTQRADRRQALASNVTCRNAPFAFRTFSFNETRRRAMIPGVFAQSTAKGQQRSHPRRQQRQRSRQYMHRSDHYVHSRAVPDLEPDHARTGHGRLPSLQSPATALNDTRSRNIRNAAGGRRDIRFCIDLYRFRRFAEPLPCIQYDRCIRPACQRLRACLRDCAGLGAST